jgi:predicted TIM-barrel fold metal-dependent hydrolase
MDRYAIQATILTFGDIAVTLGSAADRRRTASAINDYSAALIADEGDRFTALVVPPMPDVAGTVRELERGMDELGLEGLSLLTNYEGRYLGDPSYAPLYELDARAATVCVHPTGPPVDPAPGLRYGSMPPIDAIFEYTFDTTRAITSLLYNGVLTRYPGIRWQFAHGGGALPFLLHRLAVLHAFFPPWNADVPDGPLEQVAGLYFDTALAYSPAQMLALTQYVPSSHIVFGSDYPPNRALYAADNRATLGFMDPRQLPDAAHADPEPCLDDVFAPAERIAIERDNALALAPRLAKRIPALQSRGGECGGAGTWPRR